MTLRALYLCEGSSDTGLKLHIEGIAAEAGREILVTVPDLGRLPRPPGLAVAEKLRAAREFDDGGYDLALIHRDSDGGPARLRRDEIAAAMAEEWPGLAHVPVIPVRMLEAWLLLDEAAIREVAGNPNGRMPLGLPKAARVESIADPKQMLKEAIAKASGDTGRDLKKLQTRFSNNRQRLLQMLDREGPVRLLESWQSFSTDLQRALKGR